MLYVPGDVVSLKPSIREMLGFEEHWYVILWIEDDCYVILDSLMALGFAFINEGFIDRRCKWKLK